MFVNVYSVWNITHESLFLYIILVHWMLSCGETFVFIFLSYEANVQYLIWNLWQFWSKLNQPQLQLSQLHSLIIESTFRTYTVEYNSRRSQWFFAYSCSIFNIPCLLFLIIQLSAHELTMRKKNDQHYQWCHDGGWTYKPALNIAHVIFVILFHS